MLARRDGGGHTAIASVVIAGSMRRHLARRLLTRAGTSVRSTLDAPLQRFAAETLRNRLASLSERNVEDGA